MRYEELVTGLERSGALIVANFEGLTEDELRWKPARETWSLLEILGHLVDEESDDFGTRLRLTVEEPETDWPPIDPDGWVRERGHNRADAADLLARFKAGRGATLAWLCGLDVSHMASRHTHPRFGSMKAGDLLAAWCAHDLLHLAQIARTKLAWVKVGAEPYSTAYAAP